MPALRHASSDHDLCHAGKSGKLRYLKRNVVPAGGFDLGSQLLCQTDMPPKPAPVLLVHFLGLGSFHIQRCKFPLKGLRHPGSSPDNGSIGRRRGQTN